MASVLLERYNPMVYANLKEVEEVDKQVSEEEILALGNVILKHVFIFIHSFSFALFF